MPRILIVDDHAPLRSCLSDHLRQRGYDVLEAFDGENALDILEIMDCHLVITDLKMPKINGLELQRKIKMFYPNTPIAVLTGYADSQDAIEALMGGAELLLSKETRMKEIADRIDDVFKEHVKV